MFTISLDLKTSIIDRIKSFTENLEDIFFNQKDCPCQGGCGTYTEPCGSCSYHR